MSLIPLPGNEMLPHPAIWGRDFPLENFIDAIMHLIFEGILKTTQCLIQTWTSNSNKQQAFLRRVAGRMEAILRLHLDWRKAHPCRGEKRGGWVAENFVALAKIIKWFYSDLHLANPGEPEHVAPGKPQAQWFGWENKAWLKARGLSTKGTAEVLKERVATLMADEEDYPLLSDICCNAVDVQNVVIAFSAMASRLMEKEYTPTSIEEFKLSLKVSQCSIVGRWTCSV